MRNYYNNNEYNDDVCNEEWNETEYDTFSIDDSILTDDLEEKDYCNVNLDENHNYYIDVEQKTKQFFEGIIRLQKEDFYVKEDQHYIPCHNDVNANNVYVKIHDQYIPYSDEEDIFIVLSDGIYYMNMDDVLLYEIIKGEFTKFKVRFSKYYAYTRDYENSLSDITLHILTRYMNSFILKDMNHINTDAIYFQKWIYTVMKNRLTTLNIKYIKAHCTYDIEVIDGKKRFTNIKEITSFDMTGKDHDYDITERMEFNKKEEVSEEVCSQLCNVISLCLALDRVKAVKHVVWIYFYSSMTLHNFTHKDALNYVYCHRDISLYSALEESLKLFTNFTWFDLQEQFMDLKNRLDEEEIDGINIGYHSIGFYIDGSKKQKYTISDWINNINERIKRQHHY